ncbi:Sensor protein FixL [Gemmata sp. SH-PL17]|uniref:PAS domain-containing protein n=1 Tax=Gemmata sp. SH-PL17 TaxID=1630693 RepID=UPI00078C8F0D|nr:PAS domain-containing protein [Gemmata sp. SH-PL17]AMV29417.1 Sensor protein FixL [Gemmata sp. SH-PL17]
MNDPQNYRTALDNLPQLVFGAAPDGAVEYMNTRYVEYTGLPLDDLLGWNWGWVVHPADLPNSLDVWAAAVRTGTPREVSQRLRRSDGEYRWFLARAEPVRDEDGRVVRWFGTCTDIDESKRAADQLRGTRMLFRSLVERSPDGEVLVGADGTVRYANPTAARLLGFTVEELSGTDLWGSVHPDDRGAVSAWLERVMLAPGEHLPLVVRFVLRDGSVFVADVLGTNLLPDPDVRAVAIQFRRDEAPAL